MTGLILAVALAQAPAVTVRANDATIEIKGAVTITHGPDSITIRWGAVPPAPPNPDPAPPPAPPAPNPSPGDFAAAVKAAVASISQPAAHRAAVARGLAQRYRDLAGEFAATPPASPAALMETVRQRLSAYMVNNREAWASVANLIKEKFESMKLDSVAAHVPVMLEVADALEAAVK